MPEENTEHTDPTRPALHGDGIKIRAHKLLILKALQESRCQLNLSIEGNGGEFVSIVLAIDAKDDWIELDELADSEGHLALLEKKHYRASGWLKGINVDFEASIIDHHKTKGLVRYRSTLPGTIYQSQRRSSYRAPVSMMSSPEVHLILNDNQIITGQISDISASGALLSIPDNNSLKSGDKIAQCIFKTLDDKTIIVEAEVRRQIDTEHSSRSKIGCRFVNLDPPTTQTILNYTAAVERLNARRR